VFASCFVGMKESVNNSNDGGRKHTSTMEKKVAKRETGV
jgi:hypothetical protein